MKYLARLLAVLAMLFPLACSAQAHEGHLPQTDGVIKKLDLGEIVNLKMPPMTMSFKAKDPAMLKPWKEGDKVRFRSAEVKGTLTVISIEAAK
jgi:Cu/Ag efflux protein CusF